MNTNLCSSNLGIESIQFVIDKDLITGVYTISHCSEESDWIKYVLLVDWGFLWGIQIAITFYGIEPIS